MAIIRDYHLTIRSNDPDCPQTIWWFARRDDRTLTEDEMDALEEALYVLWELEPASRAPEWMRELRKIGSTLFRYAFEEPDMVRWVGDLTYEVTLNG